MCAAGLLGGGRVDSLLRTLGRQLGLDRLVQLDLVNCGLNELPKALETGGLGSWRLESLEKLNLSSDQLVAHRTPAELSQPAPTAPSVHVQCTAHR